MAGQALQWYLVLEGVVGPLILTFLEPFNRPAPLPAIFPGELRLIESVKSLGLTHLTAEPESSHSHMHGNYEQRT